MRIGGVPQVTDAAGPGRRAWYGAVVFLTAAGALVLEIVAARLVAPHIGTSLYTWSAIIAGVLAGLSIGHWIGGRLAGPPVDRRRGEAWMALSLAGAAATSVAALLLLALFADALTANALGALTTVSLLAGLLFLPPSLCVGIVSPIATTLAIAAIPDRAGPVVGRMSALGAVGSILGTLLAGFVLVQAMGSAATVLAVAALYLLLALPFAPSLSRRAGGAAVAAAVLAVGLGAWAATLPGRCAEESAYYCIAVEQADALTGRPSRLLVLNNLIHSINDRDDPGRLHTGYLQVVDALFTARMAESVAGSGRPAPDLFLVGGGGFTLPRAHLDRWPAGRAVVGEIDPTLLAVARADLWLRDLPNLTVRLGDGRAALAAEPARPSFDLILLDAFTDTAMPFHLTTAEFHALVADRLAAAGLYAINVIDRPRRPLLVASLLRTLAARFPHRIVWREDAIHARGFRQYIIAASATALPVVPARSGWSPVEAVRTRALEADPGARTLVDDHAPIEALLMRLCPLERLGIVRTDPDCARPDRS